VTGADGRFEFRNVPVGSHSLAATLEGYAAGASGRRRPGGPSLQFAVTDGARLADEVIPIWRLASVAGMVRDDRGEPVIGVSVWAMLRIINNGREELTFTGGTVEATDDRGMYRLSNLMPGTYVVMTRSITQTAAVATVDAHRAAVTSGSVPVPTYGTTGTLMLSMQGLTLGDWQVSIPSSMPQPLPGPNGTLLVHPGVFHAGARHPAEATPLTLAPGDEREGIDFTLPLTGGVRVSGVLMGPDGPASNHGIRLIAMSEREPLFDESVAYCTTDQADTCTHGVCLACVIRVPGPVERTSSACCAAAGAPPITSAEPGRGACGTGPGLVCRSHSDGGIDAH
jgi:hypothetical protein